MNKKFSRRDILQSSLAGTITMALRSLATGLPISFLLDPLNVSQAAIDQLPQRLIMLNSNLGDPMNCNVPGLYGKGFEGIVHSPSPLMKPTEFMLGKKKVVAAKPWSTIPQEFRNKMSFIHHATTTPSHNNHHKVMRLLGAMRQDEMIFSLYSKSLSPQFKTVQPEPLALSGVRISFNGRTLSLVRADAISKALKIDTTNLGKLEEIREKELDKLHNIFKERSTKKQSDALDRFATSRNQAKSISSKLLDKLSTISDSSEISQSTVAPILIAMNISPVVTLRIGFGGDNHNDTNLMREASQHVSGVNAVNTILKGLKELDLDKKVTVACLNVFGRDLQRKGMRGRDHNALHHCSFMIGENVAPSVIGSVEKTPRDWAATDINSVTGKGEKGGDITREDSLAAVGKTLGAALKVSNQVLDKNISRGKIIKAVLKS